MGSLSDEDEDEDPLDATQLLPMHNGPSAASSKGGVKGSRLADVWDEREELFSIGPDIDDEDGRHTIPPSHSADVPKIYVTPS